MKARDPSVKSRDTKVAAGSTSSVDTIVKKDTLSDKQIVNVPKLDYQGPTLRPRNKTVEALNNKFAPTDIPKPGPANTIEVQVNEPCNTLPAPTGSDSSALITGKVDEPVDPQTGRSEPPTTRPRREKKQPIRFRRATSGNALSSLARAVDTHARLADKQFEAAAAQALWIQQNQCYLRHEQMFC